MPIFIIKDSDGVEINRVLASEEFVSSNYDYYELFEEIEFTEEELAQKAEEKAREWRNGELDRTDKFMSVSDYPHTTAMQTYRQALRDWTDSETFPDTKPVFEVTPNE